MVAALPFDWLSIAISRRVVVWPLGLTNSIMCSKSEIRQHGCTTPKWAGGKLESDKFTLLIGVINHAASWWALASNMPTVSINSAPVHRNSPPLHDGDSDTGSPGGDRHGQLQGATALLGCGLVTHAGQRFQNQVLIELIGMIDGAVERGLA
ncbi:hypothetical protein BX600DRAFT_430929 [Xylariales sp. PMI_506]|nr:hypothetical protein BX600DRAFT_430929 [Xylariales sp. PMI_506]